MIFEYSYGNNFFYKIAPSAKIALMFLSSIVLMNLSFKMLIAAAFFFTAFAFYCGINLKRQFADIAPARYYFLILYAVSIVSNLLKYFSFNAFIPSKTILFFALQILTMMQMSSLIFRTMTALQIKQAIDDIETFIRICLRKIPFIKNRISSKNKFSMIISLFINFIPQEIKLWTQLDRAWRARGAKGTMKKLKTLSVVFLSISLYQAGQKEKAFRARGLD